jgi:hypothetical protein
MKVLKHEHKNNNGKLKDPNQKFQKLVIWF